MLDRSPLLAAGVALALGACSPDRVCSPGASVACVGAGGCAGGQICDADGTGFGSCDCGGDHDGGTRDAGPIDAGSDAGIDAGDDAGNDAGDGGPVVGCDPLTHDPCAAGQRCAWVLLGGGTGETRCVPDGTVAEGGACTYGPEGDTGFDDCGRDLACVGGACRRVCDSAVAGSCGADDHCVENAGMFVVGGDEVAGTCAAGCDPLTQTVSATGEPCPAGQGCYLLPSAIEFRAVCAGAGSVAIDAVVTGPVFANTCVPGATALRRADGMVHCSAFCRPIETHSGAVAGANGVTPYACAEVGGGATSDCRFAWLMSSMDPPDARWNELGLCTLPGSMGEPGAPWPSCTTLSNGDTDGDGTADHLFYGCAPFVAP